MKFPFPVELICWKDHNSANDDKWTTVKEMDHKPELVWSAGFTVKEDDEAVSLALNWGDDDGISNTIYILKSCIVSRKVLKNVRTKLANVGKKRSEAAPEAGK